MLKAAAQRLLSSHWSGHIPVDPHTFAAHQGIVLIPREDLKPECRGMVELIGEDTLTPIGSYNSLLPLTTQRETLAKLIAHCALGHLSICA